jgi:predicted nucleic acid-binding protein
MPPTLSVVDRQCWDSCVFLAYLQNKPEEAKNVQVIRDLLHQAKAGRILVVASTFTLVEVRPYADKYEPEHMAVVEDLFETNRPWFRPVALTRSIARRARVLAEQNRVLSNADVVHIATALAEGTPSLFTYDGVRIEGMRRSGQMTDFDGALGNPPLRICEPWVDLGPLLSTPPPLSQASQAAGDAPQ